MDSKPPLKYQTWFLKVSIHCDGCRRKVKKVLQSIDGVFTTKIDQQEQKVTVTGSVTVETLLRKLLRAGKHAEIWPENISVKENNKNKSNKENLENENQKKSEKQKSTQNCNKVMNKKSNTKPGQNSPEKPPSGDLDLPEENKGGQSGGGSAKKKKKKGQGDVSVNQGSKGAPAPVDTGFGEEMGQMNLIPTRQQQEKCLYTETSYPPPMVYGGAYYSRLYPMGGPSYYIPPYNIMCGGFDQEYSYQIQSRPLVSFEIFSDENANGCSIM